MKIECSLEEYNKILDNGLLDDVPDAEIMLVENTCAYCGKKITLKDRWKRLTGNAFYLCYACYWKTNKNPFDNSEKEKQDKELHQQGQEKA